MKQNITKTKNIFIFRRSTYNISQSYLQKKQLQSSWSLDKLYPNFIFIYLLRA